MRAEAGLLVDQPDGRDRVRRATGPLVVDLAVPLGQLRLQIGRVMKAPLFEEGPLHEADQILDGSFFLGPIGPAHIDAHTQFQDGIGKRRIPFGDDAVAAPFEGDGLGPIKDADQGRPAPALEMVGEMADQGLGRFVRDQRHPDRPRVLEP